ncbi:HAMP domain-containing sensor histidine kinase [Rhizobium sp.]|jgi:two-component system, OmpR family, sensor kinase|uniref:sensor histidine kinase n=1 Tax=Rhizobium sp. TaxID=391 RepID=UPI000E831ABB|nr:two-component sensor histidine kinase [Rhizobium sp.]
MKSRSITRRLLLLLCLTTSTLWLIAAGLGAVVMKSEFGEIFDSALQQTGDRLLPLVVDDLMQHDPSQVPVLGTSTLIPESDGHLIYQVRDAQGRILMQSHQVSSAPFPAPLQPGFWENGEYRIYTTAAVSNTIFVQVADSIAHRQTSTMDAVLTMMVPVLGLVPLSLVAAWLIIRFSLRPVEVFRQSISEKDQGNLKEIPLTPLPRELQPIGRSVNLLLARLRSALDTEREFTANSAHELRTPIAGALAQTQLLLADLYGPDAHNRVMQIEASLSKLSRLVEKLLQLSRAEAGIGATGETVDLIPVLDLIVEDFKRAGAERLLYRHDGAARLLGAVSEDAFAITLRNMIENALRHGDPNQPVDISVLHQRTIVVTNGGKPLEASQLQTIRKRFQRLNSTAIGSGLGLSIIERLAEQMNASFEIASPATNRSDGFEARLTFAAPQGLLPPV